MGNWQCGQQQLAHYLPQSGTCSVWGRPWFRSDDRKQLNNAAVQTGSNIYYPWAKLWGFFQFRLDNNKPLTVIIRRASGWSLKEAAMTHGCQQRALGFKFKLQSTAALKWRQLPEGGGNDQPNQVVDCYWCWVIEKEAHMNPGRVIIAPQSSAHGAALIILELKYQL